MSHNEAELLNQGILKELREALGDEDVRALMETFEAELSGRFEVLDGVVKGGSDDELEREAHSIKGLAANMAMQAVSDSAARIVQAVRDGDRSPCVEEFAHLKACFAETQEALRAEGLLP